MEIRIIHCVVAAGGDGDDDDDDDDDDEDKGDDDDDDGDNGAGSRPRVCATIRTKSFFRNTNFDSDREMMRSVTSPHRFTQIRCALRCLQAWSNCTSYLHNSTTGLCTLAPSPESLVSQLAGGDGDLYVTCDAENGYHMHRYGSATACIAVIMSARANFTDASFHCELLGGYLASVRTWDKLQLLSTAMGGNHSFWVGLDDMEEEDTYVWKEDGKVALKANETFTAAEMAEVWMNSLWDHPREPNNFGGNEDCIQVKYSTSINELRLNDFRCDTKNKFICEMPVMFN
ncbi:C-type lectin [Elysia marginata]|uniref:C-type lectin n=1 Tax=Elysia marginata TaxID=1093978 RepID=A0AAV4IJW7_9GAST|nr:C-type lectin [Elysia marginata]